MLSTQVDGQCDELVTIIGHQFIALTIYNTVGMKHHIVWVCQRQCRLVKKQYTTTKLCMNYQTLWQSPQDLALGNKLHVLVLCTLALVKMPSVLQQKVHANAM